MDRHADHVLTSNEVRYLPPDESYGASPPFAPRLEERRGETLRRLFPLRSVGRANRSVNRVALQVHAHLAEATTTEDLDERILRLQDYPAEWIQDVSLRDGRSVLVRPVLPGDASMHRAFVRSMSRTTRLHRFHGGVADLSEPLLRYLTEVDYVDHFALLGEVPGASGPRQVAEARWVRRDDEAGSADFAIAIADDYQRSGLGDRLLAILQQSAAARAIRRLHGAVLRNNVRMSAWLEARGWHMASDPDDPGVVWAELPLNMAATRQWRAAA